MPWVAPCFPKLYLLICSDFYRRNINENRRNLIENSTKRARIIDVDTMTLIMIIVKEREIIIIIIIIKIKIRE